MSKSIHHFYSFIPVKPASFLGLVVISMLLFMAGPVMAETPFPFALKENSVFQENQGLIYRFTAHQSKQVQKFGEEYPLDTQLVLGDLSRLFIHTLVLKSIDENQLQQDESVNTYLRGFKIVNPFSSPLTLHHLLSQTSGFAAKQNGSLILNPEKTPKNKAFLSTSLNPLVAAPGLGKTDQPYDGALLAYILESVHEKPIMQLMESELIAPLQLKDTQLLNASDKQAIPVYPVPLESRGWLSSPDDLETWLNALIFNQNTPPSLSSPIYQKLNETQWRVAPEMPGVTYGFEARQIAGYRALTIESHIPGHHLSLIVFPAQKTAYLFRSRHSLQNAPYALLSKTLPPGPLKMSASEINHLKSASFQIPTEPYVLSPIPEDSHSLMKFGRLFNTKKLYYQAKSGALALSDNQGQQQWYLQKQTPNRAYFIQPEAESELTLFFKDGKVTKLALNTQAFDVLPGTQTPLAQGLLAAILGLIFLSLCFRGAYFFYTFNPDDKDLPWELPILGGLISFICLLFILIFPLAFNYSSFAQGFSTLLLRDQVATWIVLPLILPLFSVVLSLIFVGFLFSEWHAKSLKTGEKLHYILFIFAEISFLILVNHWNLLGFRF